MKAEAATPFGRPREEVLDVLAHRLVDIGVPFEFVALGKPLIASGRLPQSVTYCRG